ncbi:hypothetical protein [Parvibaculum sp.]|nr:hypothetical protein [Parvibaculum sp.]MBX3487851.1 hypothetical protein [Parvibaculum sp.]
MPFVYLGIAGFGALGLWQANEAMQSTTKLLYAAAVAGGVYMAGKKMKVW